MNMHWQRHWALQVGREGVLSRRDVFRRAAASGLAAGALGWTDVLSLRADDLRRRGKACILLWMQGGPSQFETFDPKPGHENGGETKGIDTQISGVQFSENLPKLAAAADKLAVLRSLSTKEGNHQRASYLMHTSYVPTATVHHPAMGAVVANELADAACQLPSFVRIGNRFVNSGDGGFLGNRYNAFQVSDPARSPDNTQAVVAEDRYRSRLGLLDRLQGAAGDPAARDLTADHAALYKQASQMVLSPQMQAFDINRESTAARDGYGRSAFGNSCLLARRLVESGVPFVEIGLGNWDTHQNNFAQCKSLCEQMDQPFAFLLEDLRQRGMLDDTLVIWTGEFGRTPRINGRGGRDHFPRAFNAVLSGGGVRGGQVIGQTDTAGESIEDRPISEKDFFQSVYRVLGVNATREHMTPIGRPIRVVDGGEAVQELFA